jgi:cyclic pyranopterin phosphate synthase
MVDISGKPISAREAVATGAVRMSAEALHALRALPKGDAFVTAELAGVQAAKRTAELIPLCHPLPLTLVEVSCRADESLPGVRIEARVRCDAQTGAEMEALTAVSVAALTVIDMAKSQDRWMVIGEVGLQSKRGGKSGTLSRPKTRR